ncbi:hypothetical protein LD39_08125 [Halobacillus sp. BBL2006]|nr:hypothetical protein LD39_08125 [Halobacillus sp. BBL2006]
MEEEQELIFERFYRGKNKTLKVRGLGLGLPFSQMLAQTLGGELFLEKTSSQGTSFTMRLTYEKA